MSLTYFAKPKETTSAEVNVLHIWRAVGPDLHLGYSDCPFMKSRALSCLERSLIPYDLVRT